MDREEIDLNHSEWRRGNRVVILRETLCMRTHSVKDPNMPNITQIRKTARN